MPSSRLRPIALLIASSLALAGCGLLSDAQTGTGSASPPGASPPPGSVSASPGAGLPAPDEPIPGNAPALASAIERTHARLHAAIRRWTTDGDTSQPAPPDVVLLALYEQRLYRFLALHPRLASRTLSRLTGSLALQSRDDVAADRDLLSLVHPVKNPHVLRVGPPPSARELLRFFEEAQRRFGVTWEVLAAVMFVESKFGRVRSASYANAQGPMQFIASTWRAYGMGGDVHDPRDAILGAANYLHASGAPGNDRAALHAYNPAWPYVDAVLRYARTIERDPLEYFDLHEWQVFVRVPNGSTRVTGPGTH